MTDDPIPYLDLKSEYAGLREEWHAPLDTTQREAFPRLLKDTRVVERDCRLARRALVERHGDVGRHHA